MDKGDPKKLTGRCHPACSLCKHASSATGTQSTLRIQSWETTSAIGKGKLEDLAEADKDPDEIQMRTCVLPKGETKQKFTDLF